MKKILYFILGCLMVTLGTLGIVLPILPTVPFYLAAAYFWVNSSPKVHDAFVGTSLYKRYIKEMVIEKKMTSQQKRKILVSLFIVLFVPFIFIDNTTIRFGLASLFFGQWLFMSVYFSRYMKG